ncbi:hypothetical protein D3C71_2034530 [compost metagenome]
MVSTKSTMTSTRFCRPPGTPEVAFLAAVRKSSTNSRPRPMDQPRVSTWKAQKPISLACSALWAKPHSPVGRRPKVRFCR